MPDWEPYTIDEHPTIPNRKITDYGVTVLELLELCHLQKDTMYLVRYNCCGTEKAMSHKQIGERLRHLIARIKKYSLHDYNKPIIFCPSCAKRKKGEGVNSRFMRKPEPVKYVDWAPPPSMRKSL